MGLIRYFCVSASLLAAPHGMGKADGEALYKTKCQSCHGPQGNSTVPMYPKLAGQHEQYLINQTNAFMKGERKSPLAAAMIPMVKGLKPEEVRAIATYLAQQKCH